MNQSILDEWIKVNSIVERTMDSFWVSFKNYINEYPEEVSVFFDDLCFEDIKPIIDTIDYKTAFHPEYQIADSYYSQNVISTLDIYYKSKRIGYYRMFFHTDGECYDDSLVTEWMGWYITLKLEALIELKKEINDELVTNKTRDDEARLIQKIIENKIMKTRAQIHK